MVKNRKKVLNFVTVRKCNLFYPGSGDADKAKTLSNVAFILSLILGSLFSTISILARKIIPLFFTSLPEIITMVTGGKLTGDFL